MIPVNDSPTQEFRDLTNLRTQSDRTQFPASRSGLLSHKIKTSVMKYILVPCDFSKEAIEAYKFALEIAPIASLKVKVIYTINLPVVAAGFDVQPYTYGLSLQNELKEDAQKNFDKLKKTSDSPAIVTFEVVFDSITGAVRSLVGKGDVEMVLMGTKGSSGMDEVLFGSNTERVVRFSSVPVMAVRTAPRVSSIKRIVFPNRLGLDQTGLIKRVIDLQKFFSADLYVVWVNTPSDFRPDTEIIGLMKEFAHHYKLDNYTLEIRNDMEESAGILNYCHQLGADMIAMGTSGRRGVAHLFEGSIAEDVMNHVQCPIWTFSTRR
jgi:nucleotide-binding universal stress UspA family protein